MPTRTELFPEQKRRIFPRWSVLALLVLLLGLPLAGQEPQLEVHFQRSGKLENLTAGPYGFGFTENGRLIYAYSSTGEFQLWDLATGKMLPSKISGEFMMNGQISPDARFISYEYVPTEYFRRITDLYTGQFMSDGITRRPAFTAKGEAIYDNSDELEFSPDEEGIQIIVEDLMASSQSGGRAVKKFHHSGSDCRSVVAQWDSRFYYFISTMDGEKKIIKNDMSSGREVLSFGPEGKSIVGIELALGQPQLLVYTEEGPPELWDTRTGRKTGTWDPALWARKKAIEEGDFSSDEENYVVVPRGFGAERIAGEDQDRIKVWNMITGELISELSWASDPEVWRQTIALSPDGNLLLNSRMEVWEVRSGTMRYDLGSGRKAQSFDQIRLDLETKDLWLGIDQRSFLRWDLEGGAMYPGIQQRSVAQTGPRKIILEPEQTRKNDGENLKIHEANQKYGVVWERSSVEYMQGDYFTFKSGEDLAPKMGGDLNYITGALVFPDIGRQGLLFVSDDLNGLYAFDIANATPTRPKKIIYEGGGTADNLEIISGKEEDLLVYYGANTTRIWNLHSGEQLVSLHRFGKTDWVVISPSGLFDASPGAMDELYFTLFENNAWEVIELEQLKERYYEPGLLSKVLGYGDKAIRDVAVLKKIDLYPNVAADIQRNQLLVSLTARSGGIGKVSVFVNNKELIPDANPGRRAEITVDLQPFTKFYSPGENKISLRAYNADGWLKGPEIPLSYTPDRSSGDSAPPRLGGGKPSLYAICIGTADYNGTQLDLTFSGKDALAMETALQAAAEQLFQDQVYTYALSTEAGSESPSKVNIQRAFQDIAAKAQPQDIVVVYLSGHGVTYGPAEKANFYYLTQDIASEDISDTEIRNNYTLSDEELTGWLTNIAARKQVMILDACNSGAVIANLMAAEKTLNSTQIRALDRMKDRTGMFILAGSAADKVSYEATQYGQGLLTYSLLSGMSGRATQSDGRVDIMRLFQFSRDEVPELAKSIRGVQTPLLAFPTDGSSFDIGIVNGQVNIPVAQVKPVFVRNNFQDEDAFDDVLRLTDRISRQLTELTAKGAGAPLVYFNTATYDDNAYSIKGRYRQSGATVTVTAKLFRGSTAVAPIEVTGDADDLDGLVKKILKVAFANAER